MASKQMDTLLREAHDVIRGSGTNPPFNPKCTQSRCFAFHAYCCLTASPSVDYCINTFTRQQPEQFIWQTQLQEATLQRWHKWLPTIDISRREDGLDLQFLFSLFDDYFFQGWTKHRTTVAWVEYRPELNFLGAEVCDGTRAVILLMRLQPQRAWTRQSIVSLLGTLLHEMAHAFVELKGCYCSTCQCREMIPNTWGVSGHGPVWVKLCEAMEAEANRSLRGLHGVWNLDCKEHGLSLRYEREQRDAQ